MQALRYSWRTPVAILSTVASVIVMSAVSTVHEHVHQRASKEWQPNESAKDVRAVLGEE